MDEREIENEFDYRAREVLNHQRFSRRPKTTAALLSKIIAKRGFAETRRNEELQKIWVEVVGDGIARQTRLGSIRKGVLQIFVSSSAAKQHLSMIKPTLIADLQHKYHGIDDIRFKIGQ